MIERLEITKKKYNEINNELINPEIISDYQKHQKLNKEKAALEEVVLKYDEYLEILNEINGLKELISDTELGDIAKKELEDYQIKLDNIVQELEIMLIPKDENDRN